MTQTHTYTTMEVLVIDRRNGNIITDNLKQGIDASDCVIYIDPDGHVETVMRDDIKTVRVKASFAQAKHRDEISADKSRRADAAREAQRDAADAKCDPAAETAKKFARVWEDDTDGANERYPGNHGTARITGKQ